MKKRIGSLLMALVLALSLVPATVWAADGTTEVGTFEELKAAVDAENSTIILTADIDLTASLLIDSATADITIRSKEGETYTLKRAEGFTSYAINVKDGGKLTLENITLDGNGEVVKSSYPFIYMRTTEVYKQTDSELRLKSGATIQNCVTKDNASSYGGAIRSAGSVYMYEGSAITNCSSQAGGAIYLSYTTSSTSGLKKFANFTMSGGTISGCSATGSSDTAHGGGALYAYGNVNVNLNGGVIEKNTSAANGGGVFVQPFKSNSCVNTATVNLAGTTIRDNTATKRGGGVYFNGDTQDTLTASGVTTITGNSGMNGTDNVYLVAGRSLTDNGLEDGSAIGVSGPNVPSLLVAGTNVNSGCFTADRVDAKLAPTEKGLQLQAKDVHEHCICGRTDCKESGTGHRTIICTGVSSPELITTKGDYFLMNDAELSYNKNGNSWTAPAGVTLCLNGHTLRRGSNTAAAAIVVTGGNTFDLTDCQNNAGKVTSSYFSSEYNRDEARWGTGVSVAKNATFNMYGGTISGNTAYDSTNIAAGGVVVNGTFNMYGGQLVNNYRRIPTDILGSAVMVFAGGTFNLVDGLIARNASQDTEYGNTSTSARNGGAVYVKGGTFNMSGGEISKNVAGGFYAPSDGGGVYVTNSGVFNMSGGVIANNTVSRNGGGVYVANGTFTMSKQARVTGNTAYLSTNDSNYRAFNGGGVYVGANGTFTMNDSASVDTNTAQCGYKDVLASGGGVYVENGGVFTMNGQAAVKDNTVPIQYNSSFSDTIFGGGIYVNGTLNLNGGSVTGNTAYLRGGGIYVDTKATVTLGTGTVTVKDNTIHKGDFTENVYLTGDTKLVAEKAPAKNTSIGISVPLSRATAGSVVITNAEKSIKANDARFPLDISEINLERSGDDLKVTLPVHNHGAVIYTPVERLSDIKGAGNYYLVQDSLMTGQLTVAAGTTVNICLNGHKSASTNIVNNGTLTITDCLHDSANPGYLTSNYGVAITNNIAAAKLTLNSVTVKDAKGIFIDVNEKKNTETNKSGGSTVNLLNSTFTNNSGVVLDAYSTTITVRNCTFEGNKNRAIYAYAYLDYNDTARLTVENSKFINNSTPSTAYNAAGGAIYCYYYYSPATITGCTFTGNTSGSYGGALSLHSDEAKISNCTFTGNSAKWEGGAIYVQNIEDITPVLSGTIIAEDNTANGVRNNVHLDGSRSSGAYISVDSSFNTAKSHVGISADNIPTLAVKGTTDPTGFFADGGSDYTLRSTTDKSGPLLTSGNTGLELWHKGTGHTHCVCGTGTNSVDSDHKHDKTTKWIGVTTLKDLPEGNYFLLEDRSNYPYGAPWTPVGNSNLCLNGHTYTFETGSYAPGVVVGKDVNASITDCSDEGTGKLTATSGHQGVSVANKGAFTLWRGSLSNFQADSSSSSSSDYRYGGGVYVKGTFVMNGGSITGCTATGGNGGGVYVSGGTFTMNAGTITGNRVKTNSTNNNGNGGGVYGSSGTITINGGTITGNKATNGGGVYTSYCLLTVDGATITGNTATGNGGGLYIGPAKYDESQKWDSSIRHYLYTNTYHPAVIKDTTISNNTADIGGGVAAIGPFHFSGGTAITGNTAASAGAGVHSAAKAKTNTTYNTYVDWTIELSGEMNISGNKVGEAASNYYIPVGAMLPSVANLAAGSTIGVTTEVKPLKDGGTIAPVYITGDATNKNYFTSDEGYVVKLDAEKDQLYIIAESSTVTVTRGENMTVTSGDLKQTVLKNRPIADVTITAADGYYFPEDYAANLSKDGITVTRDSLTQITISGTPTAEEVTLILPAATAKTTPAAPGGLQGVAPSTWEAEDGKISGTKATMEWSADGKTWADCTDGTITVGGYGTYYVRVKATDISYASEAAEVTVPKYLKTINFPAPSLSYTYTGKEHTLPIGDEGYTVEGITKATDAGNYTATVNLDTDKYQWSSTVTDNTVSWTISKRAAQAEDFTFAAPENLIWDGHAKAATITLNAPLTLGGCKTSLVYKQGDKVVENPTDPGTYQVYMVITGDGNFAPTDGLTADSWTFTITHPADHQWGEWEHNDTQHYRTCQVPGCTKEQRAAHTTDTPATCVTKAVCTTCHAQYGEFNAHNHTEGKVTSTAYKAPTCGAAGNEAYNYCADCQKYFKDGDKTLYDDASAFDIAALTHKNAKQTKAVAPTCEVGGNDAYWYCADCGNYYADKDGKLDSTVAYNSNASFQLSALGHDFKDQPYHSDATDHWQVCKHDGCTQETAHQAHTGHEATCVAESKCQVCGYKLADKDHNNHLLAEKTEAKAPTCTQPGNDAYWHCADCGKYFADKNGDMDISKAYDTNDRFLKSALGHDFTEKLVDDAHLKSAATCTEAAVYYYDCSRCDIHSTDKTFESGDPLGHDFTEKVTDAAHLKSAATCTESAVYYYDCSRCNEHSTADTYFYGDPLGHDFTEKLVDDAHLKSGATCTEAAVYYYDCSRCDMHSADKTFTDGNPLGHSYTKEDTGADHLKSAATCTEDAVYYKSCERCGKNGTETFIAADTALGHSYTREDTGAAHLKSAATCTEDAVYYKSCERCAENGRETFTAAGTALGHDFAGQPYLHDETGHWQTCKRDGCDVSSTAEKHISDEGKITKEPTAAVEGEKTFTCTVCGLVLRTEPVAKLAPTIVEGANGKHQTGGNTDLTFRSDASFEDFLSVSVDGKVLDKNQYTLREGSILVTLKADYLSTLSVGQHTLGVTSASGTAETVFTVTAAPAVVPTGDTTGLTLWISLAALCGLGTLVVVSRKKRENG